MRHHQHQAWQEWLPVDFETLHIFTSFHAGQGDNKNSCFADFWILFQSWSNLSTIEVLESYFVSLCVDDSVMQQHFSDNLYYNLPKCYTTQSDLLGQMTQNELEL